MNKTFTGFNKLKDRACDYMKEELFYSDGTICTYERTWRKIRTYMIENGHSVYNRKIGELYINYYLSDKKKEKLSRSQKLIFNHVRSLSHFSEKSTMELIHRGSAPPPLFLGFMGSLIELFLLELKSLMRTVYTTKYYSRYLHNFMEFCNKQKIKSSKEINLPLILLFIHQYDKTYVTTLINLTTVMRTFTRFLYEKQLIHVNLSKKIPNAKNVKQPKLPSYYSEEEIRILVNSIDRSSAIGKRNFAIILLAVKYGLRASDIAKLRFEEIDWGKNTINLRQHKTGKEITLPLTAEVGNAIIDYLKYGRREKNIDYIFLLQRPPFDKITSKAISLLTRRAFNKSGIKIGNRKSGVHTLRHSFASRMLEKAVPIHVTQEVLGHRSLQSTKYYLRIDLNSMQLCCLEVPTITKSFYEQGGGKFYE